MSTWALAESLLDEGEGDDALAKLLRRITATQGEHEADELRDKLKGMPLRDVKKFVSLRYMDPKADDLADRMVAGFQGMAVGPYSAPVAAAPPASGQKRGEAPSDRPDPRKPWAAPLGNKIKGLPSALPPQDEPSKGGDDDFGAEEPTERDADIDSLMGRTRGERPSGFVDPAKMQATKSQQAATVGASRAKEKESGIIDAQKRLWHFAQKYGPDSPTERGTPRNDQERASAQRLVDRMAAQYGVPVPATDSNGRPKILSADQLMRRREAEPASGKRAPAAVHKPPFRGTYVGQVWRPSGVGQQVTRWFADMATGQMARAKRETNPRLEGDEVVWSGTEWVPAELWLNKVKSGQVQPRMTKTDVPTDAGSLPFSWAKKRHARLD